MGLPAPSKRINQQSGLELERTKKNFEKKFFDMISSIDKKNTV